MKRVSEETPAKTKKKRLIKTIQLSLKLYHFLKWLQMKGVNISEFTRQLWKMTPEWEDFEKDYENIKKWIDE